MVVSFSILYTHTRTESNEGNHGASPTLLQLSCKQSHFHGQGQKKNRRTERGESLLSGLLPPSLPPSFCLWTEDYENEEEAMTPQLPPGEAETTHTGYQQMKKRHSVCVCVHAQEHQGPK